MSPTRVSVLGVSGLVALGVVLALHPARGQQIHRHTFSGRQTALVRGDANVRAEEKEHDVSTQSFRSQPSSEHLKLAAEAGTGDAAYIHYFYETPPAPVTELLSASVCVKATKPGTQLRARVVFPKEPDPARPEMPLTMLVVGPACEKTHQWQKLDLGNVPELVGKHLPALQARVQRPVNTADAYIDRLVLNVYTGPGQVDIWVDDLDIGPVQPGPQGAGPPNGGGAPGVPVKRPNPGEPAAPRAGGRQIEHRDRHILVNGSPYFFRAIRHSGTPLHVLRSAGFEALWLPTDAPVAVVEEANREGWMLIPSAPLATFPAVADRGGADRDADRLLGFLRRFSAGDVLFWDLGGGRRFEQVEWVASTARAIQDIDRRPRGADLWDGFQQYSLYLDVVGAHRWPLFSSLELADYYTWLKQRKELAGGRPVFWTWVQNHLPDWYAEMVGEPADDRAAAARRRPGPVVPAGGVAPRPDLPAASPEGFADPVGPQPEQVRILAYLGIAAGCRGLGFWSDRFLADSHHGRDRLQQMALLNAELDLLSPVILSVTEKPIELPTSNHNVKAFLLKGSRGALLLAIWMGAGTQYVPEQGAVLNLTINVPLVPDGADPWLITPAGPENLRHLVRRDTHGTVVTIPEFDMVSPIVFTDDLKATGLVVYWQDRARLLGRHAARWAMDLASAEYEKTRVVYQKLADLGVTIRGADVLFAETQKFYRQAQQDFAHELYKEAYQNATRALRPLRVVMWDHWRQAAGKFPVATASPYAVSYFTLPKHWELYREVQASKAGANLLPGGDFEPEGVEVPKKGLPIETMPGWAGRWGALDKVDVAAAIIPSDTLVEKWPPRSPRDLPKSIWTPSRRVPLPDEGYTPPQPELGDGCLRLQIEKQVPTDRDGKPLPTVPYLERTFLAVDSPAVRLPPGTLVRISAWAKVIDPIQGTVDGALIYDNPGYDPQYANRPHAGGEPLAVRVTHTRPPLPNATRGTWRQYHLYRRVSASGQIGVTLALTGLGTAYFDDVRIEPLIAGGPGEKVEAARLPSRGPGGPAAGPTKQPVAPAGYVPPARTPVGTGRP